MAEGRLEYGPPRTAKGEQTQKDVKINGTNYVKSFRINKSVKKRTQNELEERTKNAPKSQNELEKRAKTCQKPKTNSENVLQTPGGTGDCLGAQERK
jgi:hypothetical protein